MKNAKLNKTHPMFVGDLTLFNSYINNKIKKEII